MGKKKKRFRVILTPSELDSEFGREREVPQAQPQQQSYPSGFYGIASGLNCFAAQSICDKVLREKYKEEKLEALKKG